MTQKEMLKELNTALKAAKTKYALAIRHQQEIYRTYPDRSIINKREWWIVKDVDREVSFARNDVEEIEWFIDLVKEDPKHTEWRVKEILAGFWAGYDKAPVKDEATA